MFIDIKDARKHYGEGETLVNALDGVSLSLGEGRIYVILGPSGSGKSTLLNMIGGLDSLDSGEDYNFRQEYKQKRQEENDRLQKGRCRICISVLQSYSRPYSAGEYSGCC